MNLIDGIQLRASQLADRAFLLRVFTDSRPDLAMVQQLPDGQSLLRYQFEMDEAQTKANYPNAEHDVVLYKNEPIGRFVVDRSGADYSIIWLGLLATYRRRGIGTSLLRHTLERARSECKGVRLQVAWFNFEALRLYERLGFTLLEDRQVYKVLYWHPASVGHLR